MLDIISKNKLPKDVELSPDIRGRAEGYIRIRLHGLRYYIPITKEFKKLFKVLHKENKFIFPSYNIEKRIEDFFRDFIQIMYLQVREEVGSEIHCSLSQELSEGFNNLFSHYLSKKIQKGFEKQKLTWRPKDD